MVKRKYKMGWKFKDLSDVVEYYERTGIIIVTFWGMTKSEFLKEIKRFENVINTVDGDVLERNREYLHRLYTIKFELGI